MDSTGVTRAEGGAEACPIHTARISPEVQNGVGDGGGPVVKGLNDNGEAWGGGVSVTGSLHT